MRIDLATRAHTVPKFYLQGFVDEGPGVVRDPYVWVGRLKTGQVVRRAPKNLSIVTGLYDGPGGLGSPDATLERHLQSIESAASRAIREFVALPPKHGGTLAHEISRFLAWQAARTPGWLDLVQDWANGVPAGIGDEIVEAPPEGLERTRDAFRPLCLEDPATGQRRYVADEMEFSAYRGRGWKWVFQSDDYLESIHLQAWYLQIRHFPRLNWSKLTAPAGESFVTSDRAVAWLVDGYADTPPAALRHPKAQVVAPLTKTVALVGRHGTQPLEVTPRQVNRFVAFAASEWIAGASRGLIEQTIADRHGSLH